MLHLGVLIVPAMLLAACQPDSDDRAPEIRPVSTATVAKQDGGELVTLTGNVQAKDEASLAFRVSGHMVERPANVGDRVEAGQVVARLDDQNAQNTLRSAQAALNAAEGQLDDRFHETASWNLMGLLVDSSFAVELNEERHHGKMAASARVGDDR